MEDLVQRVIEVIPELLAGMVLKVHLVPLERYPMVAATLDGHKKPKHTDLYNPYCSTQLLRRKILFRRLLPNINSLPPSMKS